MIKLNLIKNSQTEESEPPGKKVKDYYNTSIENWNNWKWQLKNSVTSLEQLSNFFSLTEIEKKFFENNNSTIPLRITPYYLNLIDTTDIKDPLRKAIFPSILEKFYSDGEEEDPLGEEKDSVVDGIVHRYPDRVLFLVTNFCSVYCRYCTRSRMVGKNKKEKCDLKRIDRAIEYIKKNTMIRDVLLSGGDPLTLPTKTLEYILMRLKEIEHVEMIRIGTKVPVVLPQRINNGLVSMLKKYHPLYISIHFTHPNELTDETAKACNKLADAGIPLGSQTVLLKDINDNIVTMKKLMTGLLKIRVKPYYLYQCDPIKGSSHFRTNIEKGLEIIKGLRGYITGYGVPAYVIDAPKGGGKIPLLPDYLVEKNVDKIVLKNYQDRLYYYPNVSTNNEMKGVIRS